MTPPGPGRRERVRQGTLAEIRAAARTLLVERGPEAVTINAVARELGMSGPALYHYYAGRDELVGAVTADLYRDLTDAMRTARDTQNEPARQMMAACRALRAWAVAHPAEFGWIFAAPTPPAGEQRPGSLRELAGYDFEQVLLEPFQELWKSAPFPIAADDELDPAVRDQLAAYAARFDRKLPLGALHIFMACWMRLYGLLCMEVLHQFDFVYPNLGPLYEECLRDIAALLGQEGAAAQ
ncbi:TetR/AcrR family transcriptional regulator [Actinomadura hibisca]|uniref:TetR/AcrR family transcriptional regulator n=1 Tax=Actinomadura hibisca TaxID=68565 RepID=UPI00082EDC5B|nr:TetR/AcrR family transcriptional regulator [Actinomadura hibisca]